MSFAAGPPQGKSAPPPGGSKRAKPAQRGGVTVGYYFLTVPAVRAKRARNFSTRPVSTMRVCAPV